MATSPAYHDHPPQRLLQNLPDTTGSRNRPSGGSPSGGTDYSRHPWDASDREEKRREWSKYVRFAGMI